MRDLGAARAVVRRRLVAVVAALLLALLTGCAAIPTDGPVTAGRSGQRDSPAGFGVLPDGPDPDETPEGIVRGFLLAAAGVENNFEVARTFLSPSAGTRWQPSSSTVVYRGSAPAVAVLDPAGTPVPDVGVVAEQARVSLGVTVAAGVDGDGRYVPAQPGTTRQAEFVLQKVSGQWRIAQLADEVLISDTEFELLYRPYELYFLDRSRTYLVPETRWFPDRPSTATSLVTELLAGPSAWLSSSVTTSFPPGTRLDLDAVPVEDGLAQVDLTEPARSASPQDRSLMQAQLEATVVPVPTVSTVQMTVDGSVIEQPGAARVQRDLPVGEAPVMVQDSTLVTSTPSRVTPVGGLPSLDGLQASNPGVAYGLTSYAVLVAQRSRLLHLVPGGEVGEPLLTGADLTAPSFDRYSWIWSTPADCTGAVSAVRSEGTVVPVAAPWLDGRRVTSLRISRDGARALVASTDADGRGHVDVAGVVRGPGDQPVRLEPLGYNTIGTELAFVGEAVWVDQVRVAVLGRRAEEPQDRVHVLRLGGPVQAPLPLASGAESVAAGRGERSVVVGTADGELLQQAGAVWIPVPGATGVRDPAFPG